MKINHLICPNCGHDFYVSSPYGTCDACGYMFYATQSQTCKPMRPFVPAIKTQITLNGIPFNGWRQDNTQKDS